MEPHSLRRSPLAGVGALVGGLAWVAWAILNKYVHGGLDVGPPAIGEGTARIGAFLMVAWNLMLVPAALALDDELRPRAPDVMRIATVAGIASLLFWAFGGATRTITNVLEVTYIALSAVWWGGVGRAIRPARPIFGTFTVVLAAFAARDAIVTSVPTVPLALFMTAAPKLPLSIVWDFWVAVLLDARRMRPATAR